MVLPRPAFVNTSIGEPITTIITNTPIVENYPNITNENNTSAESPSLISDNNMYSSQPSTQKIMVQNIQNEHEKENNCTADWGRLVLTTSLTEQQHTKNI